MNLIQEYDKRIRSFFFPVNGFGKVYVLRSRSRFASLRSTSPTSASQPTVCARLLQTHAFTFLQRVLGSRQARTIEAMRAACSRSRTKPAVKAAKGNRSGDEGQLQSLAASKVDAREREGMQLAASCQARLRRG